MINDKSIFFSNCLYEGEVYHIRSMPKKHEFRYKVFSVNFDLSMNTQFHGLELRTCKLHGVSIILHIICKRRAISVQALAWTTRTPPAPSPRCRRPQQGCSPCSCACASGCGCASGARAAGTTSGRQTRGSCEAACTAWAFAPRLIPVV